jgi:nucleotide-binding universal stress UspA family protein
MSDREEFAVHRIVVAIDSSPHGRAALETAAAIAARLHAEVLGLFVEDIDLVNLAGLPVGRMIPMISGESREFNQEAMEDNFRMQVARARRELRQIATRTRIVSSFRVVRGRVDAEIVAAAAEGELLILGSTSRSVGFGGRAAGSVAVAAAERSPRSVLLIRPGAHIEGKALLVHDGSAESDAAIGVAANVVGGPSRTLTVLIVADTAAKASDIEARVRLQLMPFRMTPAFLQVHHLEIADLCRLASQSGSDVLVISGKSPMLAGGAHARLLEQVGCPVLIVR